MTKSKQDNNDGDEVYVWIERLQKNPDDEKTKEQLVTHFNNLVHSLARKYSYNRGNHDDLAQIGMIGLLVAIERFDPTFGKSFEAFAIPTILGEMKRYLRDRTWSVHVPRRIKELGPKITRAVDELTRELQKSPTVSEIATYLDVSEEEVLETMEMSKGYNALSIDYEHESDGDGGAVTILDLIGTEEELYEQVDLKVLLEGALLVLPKREQLILKYLFFDHMSQQEVGDILGISQMHVSRLQRRALRKLREVLDQETDTLFVRD